ncbi:MAG: MBG domain-containing protein [Pseudomonas sp.]|uniref:MBG domain-containing protein n=1 Tax=Pseudomonas sp. TaxID=306 RepID=UPI0039819E3D
MNRTYALVWNPSLGAWTVTDERARRRGKGAGAVLAAALLLPLMASAADLPTGGNVVSGSGAINQPNAQQMVIDQASNKLAIDWQSFDIAAGKKVTFNQPGSDAIALNRVLGADGSKIMGQLDANGRVFLINPNGVLFGAGAQVNVGGLVASTLNISNSDFEAGNYSFKGDGSNARVINNGTLNAADGGSIALLGGTVSNNGVIVANQGTVALAAGNAVTLDFAGDGLLNVQVDEAVVDALVENHQLIKADGGQVLLTANAGDALLKTVVNNTGVIEAQTLGEKDGKIVLLGSFDGGTVQVAGTLDASAPKGGNGGFIETSGAHVKVANGAKVTTKATNGKTGTWLIDPTDFTVSAGNDDQSSSGIGANTLSSNLASNSVTLQTVATGSEAGDINVNAAVTWNAATTLTLNAHNNININAAITAQHADGKVALKYGQASSDGGTADYNIKAPINLQSGQNFSTQKGSNGTEISYTVVNDAAALQAMNNNLADNYAVGSNIDLSSISNWVPVGTSSIRFTGRLDGLGHTLSNLTINRSGTNYVGLFGYAGSGSVIRDIGLVGGSVSGNNVVGGLVGRSSGNISNAYATGSVSGTYYVGGLVGQNFFGTISTAYATGSVSGGHDAGGLVGENYQGTINNAYATGRVSGINYVGGLVALNESGTINNAYATGSVSGNNYVAGLVGYNNSSTISNAYATGSVSGNNYVGGLVGYNSYATISNAYATGSVSGTSSVGGLVGSNYQETINSSFYATTNADGSAINDSGATTGAFTGNAIGTGKTWAELNDPATFASWDTNIWSFPGIDSSVSGYGVSGRPYLTGVTRQVDIVRSTLFAGGFGTQNDAYTITSWQQLANINQVLSGGYTFSLSNNLDQNSSGYATLASATANAGAGWNPLGNFANRFTGTFDGLGHTLSGLVINRSDTDSVGLFGATGSGSVIRDIGLVGGSVLGSYKVGGLVGGNEGTISNAYNTGSVSGTSQVGGLLGDNESGTISNAYATGSVSGANYVGGLIGYNSSATISNTYATGSVSGTNYVGGLVGYSQWGTITNTYATGSVSGTDSVGGLLGYKHLGTINSSFYATTNAAGNAINNSGATTAPFSGNANGTAKTWAELTQASTFTGWDIATTSGSNAIWRIYDGYSGPLLRSFLKSVTVTVDSTGKVYDGTNSLVAGASYSLSDNSAPLLGNASYTSVATRNAGTYALGLTGLYSNQQGYDISVAAGSYTIAKADLSVTALNASKNYDGLAFISGGNGVSYNGFVNGEDANVLGGTLTYSGSAQGAINAGSYGLNLSGLTASNYAISYNAGSLTIDKAQATVTANSGQVVYNGQQQSIAGFTASGLVNGETTSVLSGVSTSGGNGTNAGSYILSASGTDGNYALTFVDGNLTIDKAQATVTANSGQVTYNGQQQSIAGFTASGLVNGETTSVLSGVSTSGGGTNVGNYTLSASGTDGNYDLTFVDGSLTIDKAQATVTANSGQVTYNGQQQSIAGFTASGLVNGETTSVLSGVSTSGGSGTNAGSYTHSAAGTDGNYDLTFVDGNLTIAKAQATVTANSGQVTYNGQQQSIAGFIASGLVNGETTSVLSGVSTTGGSGTNAGSYTLSASGTDGNYLLTFVDGNLTIDKAQATVTANSSQVIYNGQQQNIAGFTASGLVNGETTSVLSGVSTNGGSGTNAGSYTLSANGSDDNYALTFVDGSLTIDKAHATITANSGQLTYNGQQQSIAGFTASGLVNGETTSVLSGVSTTGGSGTNAGNYTHSASGTDGNYELTFADGSLTIDKAQATVTANSGQMTYNGQQQNITGFTASGLVNGETASVLSGVSTSGGSGSNAGSYTHSATGMDGNYDLSFIDGALTINKAALTITANNASKTAGQSIALSGYSASGLVGDDSISAVSLSSLGQPTTAAAGNYAIVASDAIGAALSNYAISYQDGSLLVSPAPITPTTPSSQQPTASTPPYIGVLASNGQSLSTQAPQQTRQETVSEPEVLNPQMLMTNPLADIMNLQVINQGIRLPEGI